MKIPGSEERSGAARLEFVHDVITKCLSTREERCTAYRVLRQFYLWGRESSADPNENILGTVNKIYSHMDQVVSFLYSQDTTRFSVEIGKSVSELELLKLPALNEAINDHWHSSNTDIRYGDALTWSLVYGTTFLKPRWHVDHIIPDVVEPHNVGVWREDIPGLENQDAFVHCYRIPKEQLRYELTVANHPDVEGVLKEAVADTSDVNTAPDGPITGITTSTGLPNATGELSLSNGPRVSYAPRVGMPMVQMYEVYIWNDDIHDYQVFTVAHPFVILYDRAMEKMFLANELPLVQVCPYPLPDYFYGVSLCERLISLQMMRNVRWDQVQHMMEMQASPASFATGQFGTVDEVQDALDTPGGLVLGDQGNDLKKLTVEVPDDMFSEIAYLDSQFDEVDGTTPIMSGKGEEGVRSEGHASQLLRVGASRAKRRALIVEDSLEDVATLYLKILQKFSDAKYRMEPHGDEKEGMIFVANQFTDNFMVKVDAHSNSPLFMQDLTQTAFELFKAKAIDRETLIDMLAVPMKDLLKLKLKTKIEPAEARAAEEQRKIELQTGKVSPIHGKK